MGKLPGNHFSTSSIVWHCMQHVSAMRWSIDVFWRRKKSRQEAWEGDLNVHIMHCQLSSYCPMSMFDSSGVLEYYVSHRRRIAWEVAISKLLAVEEGYHLRDEPWICIGGQMINGGKSNSTNPTCHQNIVSISFNNNSSAGALRISTEGRGRR